MIYIAPTVICLQYSPCCVIEVAAAAVEGLYSVMCGS